jgi:hypothetical protein
MRRHRPSVARAIGGESVMCFLVETPWMCIPVFFLVAGGNAACSPFGRLRKAPRLPIPNGYDWRMWSRKLSTSGYHTLAAPVWDDSTGPWRIRAGRSRQVSRPVPTNLGVVGYGYGRHLPCLDGLSGASLSAEQSRTPRHAGIGRPPRPTAHTCSPCGRSGRGRHWCTGNRSSPPRPSLRPRHCPNWAIYPQK